MRIDEAFGPVKECDKVMGSSPPGLEERIGMKGYAAEGLASNSSIRF